MQPSTQINENTIGVLLVESQPPHTGEFLQARQMLDKYDKLYVCITKQTIVMPLQNVLRIWAYIFSCYRERMKITWVDLDFAEAEIDDFPELFDGCTYLTSDKAIFVHLSMLNQDVQLIPKAFGYHGIFLRSAYRQSKALDWLELKCVNQAEAEKMK